MQGQGQADSQVHVVFLSGSPECGVSKEDGVPRVTLKGPWDKGRGFPLASSEGGQLRVASIRRGSREGAGEGSDDVTESCS